MPASVEVLHRCALPARRPERRHRTGACRRVHPGELDWSGTWVDRAGRDRTPSVPGHELSGVVVELGYGTTGLSVGQRVFGLSDWTRNGSLAEYCAVEPASSLPFRLTSTTPWLPPCRSPG